MYFSIHTKFIVRELNPRCIQHVENFLHCLAWLFRGGTFIIEQLQKQHQIRNGWIEFQIKDHMNFEENVQHLMECPTIGQLK